MRTWTTQNRPLLTPKNHLCTTHISIAFIATSTETKEQVDDNRSIGRNYCIGTTTDGPYVVVGIVACKLINVVNALCT
jgi:hypothetical protein